MISRFIVILVTALSFNAAHAELRVSLLTVDPGPEIYQLEGHAELRFVDPDRQLDSTVSWGVFDFNSPGFVYRFVKGETDYLALSYPFSYFLAANSLEGRHVTEDILNLTDTEVTALYGLVAENIKPENRVYRYNYVKDNCATRPLELIERAIGAKLLSESDTLTSSTWRKEMTSYHINYPWYQFGIDLALGSGIDVNITGREKCYSPVSLRQYIKNAKKPDGSPLVVSESQTLIDGTTEGKPLDKTPWFLSPMCVSIIIMLVTVFNTLRSIKEHRLTRWWNIFLYSIATIIGIVLTYLIFISTHEATSPNWLILMFNPLAIIFIFALWLKKHNPVVMCYQIVNFVALLTLSVIGVTGIQHLNPAIWPLITSYLMTSVTYIYINRCQKKSQSL